MISPGGVGYDINCGVRLLRTNYTERDIHERRTQLLAEMSKAVPAGVGKGGITRLSRNVLLEVCAKGAEWAVENGYGTREDLQRTEESGRMEAADPSYLSPRAVERGIPQLGTLGAGNHFLEIQKVSEIYDEQISRVFGIQSVGQVLMMIHCGSRGLGHQVASDYIRLMENKFGIGGLPDRELINAPIRSQLGEQYYKSMSAAVNYAFLYHLFFILLYFDFVCFLDFREDLHDLRNLYPNFRCAAMEAFFFPFFNRLSAFWALLKFNLTLFAGIFQTLERTFAVRTIAFLLIN
ncbi:hypothetical protein ES705_50726 [subsurface metagenome]